MTPLPEDEPPVADLLLALGLPGVVDAHVHFLPPALQERVWAVFDSAGPKIGRPWPIRYRYPHEQRVEQLRALGVRAFPTLPYAHRPGIAPWLNDWSREFAAGVPECLVSATFYPEPGAAAYVADALAQGAQVLKIHTQVGEFALDDPLLDDTWGLLAEAQVPVVTHVGSGPVPNAWTGPEHLERLLRRHPRVPVVVAHMGAPEYADFLALVERHPTLRLDTTMVFTSFFDDVTGDLGGGDASYPGDLLPRLADLGDRVLFGSDFPTIPYPYREQLEGVVALQHRHPGLGPDWLRRVLWHNGVELFGLDADG